MWLRGNGDVGELGGNLLTLVHITWANAHTSVEAVPLPYYHCGSFKTF